MSRYCFLERGLLPQAWRSVINDTGKPFQFQFGLRIKVGCHFMNLVFFLTPVTTKPHLAASSLHM
jgi:hypothetical protein